MSNRSFVRAAPYIVGLAWLLRAVPCPAAVLDAVWNGGSGTWNAAANWSGGVVPANTVADSFRVFIDGGKAEESEVTLNVDVTTDALTIDANDRLTELNGRALVIIGGPAVNHGLWALDSLGAFTDLQFWNGVTLSGGGAVQMSDSVTNRIVAVNGSDTLDADDLVALSEVLFSPVP